MHTVKKTINGKELSLETGRFAKLAAGSVMVRYGDTMVLVTAQSAADARPDIDFLPLTGRSMLPPARSQADSSVAKADQRRRRFFHRV